MRKTKAAAEQEAARQAEQEAAQQARARAALRWTDDTDIAPDVPPPGSGESMTTGWMFNSYYRRVEEACSSSFGHAVGQADRTTSQHPIALYSTRERALRALRVSLEREFAAELAKIDAQLEGTRA